MNKIFTEDATPIQKVLGITALGLGVNYLSKYYKKNKKLPTTLVVIVSVTFLLSLSDTTT